MNNNRYTYVWFCMIFGRLLLWWWRRWMSRFQVQNWMNLYSYDTIVIVPRELKNHFSMPFFSFIILQLMYFLFWHAIMLKVHFYMEKLSSFRTKLFIYSIASWHLLPAHSHFSTSFFNYEFISNFALACHDGNFLFKTNKPDKTK